ncbi:MAG: hypothetical protein K1X29_02540 [Bdellovibrionales bacterium]|nr:hypothetical protein [Bdellovibrionales bacterium]
MVNENEKKNENQETSSSFDETEESGGTRLTEALKKIVAGGLGAAFMTEENIRNYISELKLPKEVLKDVIHSILQSASKSKEELATKVGNEVIKLINKIDLVKEASRFVEEHKFKITAEVDVVKKETSEPQNK